MNILKKLIIATILLFSYPTFAQETDYCNNITDDIRDRILQEVVKKNPTALKDRPDCFLLDRRLILKATLIDPSQFQNAAEILKEDESFVRRLLKVNPVILQYASPKLRGNKTFMENATYLDRNALQYAAPQLLDNKLFMRRMIKIDSRNYIFASNRLKELSEFAEVAFQDDGMLLIHAPESVKADRKLVEIAFKSNNLAIEYASEELKKDKKFKYEKKKTGPEISRKDLEEFVHKNYVTEDENKNLGSSIANWAQFFYDNNIISCNYVTKWQRAFNSNPDKVNEDLHLITATSRNYQILWKEDFKEYPALMKKIENFFLSHNIDRITIDNLSTTYLWKIKNKPLTLAFNLYLLRDTSDSDLGPKFSGITSLTAIVQKKKNKWDMSVVEVVFDSEVEMKIDYVDGHKKYILWDLYKVNKRDKNPKIIFKVEDNFKEYFEIFEEESGGKYEMIYHIEPLFQNKLK